MFLLKKKLKDKLETLRKNWVDSPQDKRTTEHHYWLPAADKTIHDFNKPETRWLIKKEFDTLADCLIQSSLHPTMLGSQWNTLKTEDWDNSPLP